MHIYYKLLGFSFKQRQCKKANSKANLVTMITSKKIFDSMTNQILFFVNYAFVFFKNLSKKKKKKQLRNRCINSKLSNIAWIPFNDLTH